MEVKTSICRNCAATCPILVTIHDNKILKVEGDPDAPIYNGYACPKGLNIPKQHARPNRLMQSLKRLPDGRQVPISSDQLVEEVTAKLSRIIDESGPESVAAFLGGGVQEQWAASSMMGSFLAAIKSPMMFSAATIDQPGGNMSLALHGGWEGGRIHPKECEVFLVVGGNPIVSKQHFPQNPAQQIKALTDAGMKMIVIDPRRTETARKAAVHLQTIPGEDPTVLAGLIHLIFKLNGVDGEFVKLNADGAEALREATKDFTPDYVADRAGIDAEDLVKAAKMLVTAKKGETATGVGPSFATRGTLTSYLALCILSLRGWWAGEGARFARPPVLLPKASPKAQPGKTQPAWGFGIQTGIRGLGQTAAGMPTAALPDMMISKKIRAAFLHAGAIYTWPQTKRTIEALNALDLFVMHDLEVTPTSALAHYVIATKSQLETPGMSHLGEACGKIHTGYSWTEPFAMYQPATIEPPKGSDLLEAWQIYYRIAQKLGLQLEIFDGTDLPRPQFDMNKEPTTDDVFELMCKNSAIPLERVKQYPHGAIFDDARVTVGPRDADCTAKQQIGEPHMMDELRQVRSEDIAARRKTNDDYPFLMVSRRVQTTNSSGLRVEKTHRAAYNPAFMHPDDLARLKLAPGTMVEISSRHGSILGFVEADPDLRPGVLSMTHGFGARHGKPYDPRQDGANVNELISWDDDPDPYHGMPRMGALPVSVKAAEEKLAAAS